MARYIDAEHLFKCKTCRHHRSGGCDTWCENGECYSPDMSKIPTADVVESNEKHIPKKLKVEVVLGRNVISLYYYCPSCNSFRMETTKHCSNCGQALDWKETFLEYALEKAYENSEKLVEESEVVKVKHGKWKECFEDWRKQIAGDECSVCGFQHYGTSITNYNYCPNCGARMDGDT